MRDNCPADLHSSLELIVRHVFGISEKIQENMPENYQASCLGSSETFLGLSGIFFGMARQLSWDLMLIFWSLNKFYVEFFFSAIVF